MRKPELSRSQLAALLLTASMASLAATPVAAAENDSAALDRSGQRRARLIADNERPPWPRASRRSQYPRPSLLRAHRRQRPGLRLPPARLRHEHFGGEHAATLARDRRQGSGLRPCRRIQLPQPAAGQRASHSLLLERGLFRISCPGRPRRGRLGMSRSSHRSRPRPHRLQHRNAFYGLKSANPTVSVFRRPRVGGQPEVRRRHHGRRAMFIIKNGLPAARDPETGMPINMNMMADARVPTLKTQAADAALTHLQVKQRPAPSSCSRSSTSKNRSTPASDSANGRRARRGGRSRRHSDRGILPPPATACSATTSRTPVFAFFDRMEKAACGRDCGTKRIPRLGGARQGRVLLRPFWIRDAMHSTPWASATR